MKMSINDLETYEIKLTQLLRHMPIEYRKKYIEYSVKHRHTASIREINDEQDIDGQFYFSATAEGNEFWYDIYMKSLEKYLKHENRRIQRNN